MNKRDREESTSPEKPISKIHKMSTEELANAITNISTQLTNLNINFGSLDSKLSILQTTVTSLDSTITEALNRLKKNEETIALIVSQQEAIYAKINEFDQKGMVKCFRLTGFPARQQKTDAFPAVEEVFKHIGLKVTKSDFKKLFFNNFRNNTDAQITGEFYDERTKDAATQLFKDYRKARPLLLGKVCPDITDENWKSKEVRLRSELTPATRKLLAEARQHTEIFEFIWEANGRVLMKKDENSRAFQVRSSSDIKKAVTNNLSPGTSS